MRTKSSEGHHSKHCQNSFPLRCKFSVSNHAYQPVGRCAGMVPHVAWWRQGKNREQADWKLQMELAYSGAARWLLVPLSTTLLSFEDRTLPENWSCLGTPATASSLCSLCKYCLKIPLFGVLPAFHGKQQTHLECSAL